MITVDGRLLLKIVTSRFAWLDENGFSFDLIAFSPCPDLLEIASDCTRRCANEFVAGELAVEYSQCGRATFFFLNCCDLTTL